MIFQLLRCKEKQGCVTEGCGSEGGSFSVHSKPNKHDKDNTLKKLNLNVEMLL